MNKQTTLSETKAHELATKQREISVSEFFTKNRHLLGFDNPRKALLTTVKEAIDNSLDACEEARILPILTVTLKQTREDRLHVTVRDNGPGIVKEQIPLIFGKLLYGSKFFSYRQQRGQQGIGVSAVVLYSQLTTGKSAKIISRIGKQYPAHFFELNLKSKVNEAEIVSDKEIEWDYEHGTEIQVDIEAKYMKGKQGVEEYLRQTAIANPHAEIAFIDPFGTSLSFPRATKELPLESKEIKPHPYGIELGALITMLKLTQATTLLSFLTNDFSRISLKVAKEICAQAHLSERSRPSRVARQEAEKLYDTIKQVKIIAPPTDCLSPIGEEQLQKSLHKEIVAEFYCAITRKPVVYRGNPFLIEIGLAYGGNQLGDDSITLYRFANKVPLQYQQGACAITKAVTETSWKAYGLSQSRGGLPVGPLTLVVHLASVWVPFTSEGKEAVAHYDEIIKEIKLGLQDCGRKLGSYIRKHIKAKHQKERVTLFVKYVPEVAASLHALTGEDDKKIAAYLQSYLDTHMHSLVQEGKIDGNV